MSDGNKLILGVVVVVLAIFGVFLYSTASQNNIPKASSNGSTGSGSQTVSTAFAVLTPAKVPPKVAECSEPITFSSSGASGPVQCSNGDLNTTEWASLAALEPTVLSLGYSPSVAQVEAALCSDVKANISNAIELIVYKISALYYGWQFSSNPTAVITNGTCVNVDD